MRARVGRPAVGESRAVGTPPTWVDLLEGTRESCLTASKGTATLPSPWIARVFAHPEVPTRLHLQIQCVRSERLNQHRSRKYRAARCR